MYKVAVLTASDRASEGLYEDRTGPLVRKIIQSLPAVVVCYDVVADERERIKEKLISYCDERKVDLVLTDGGTGFSSRDCTPEATQDVIERHVPGIPEAMRRGCFPETPRTMFSRGIAGIRGKTLIINLPGSPQGAQSSLDVIMPFLAHGLDMLREQKHAT